MPASARCWQQWGGDADELADADLAPLGERARTGAVRAHAPSFRRLIAAAARDYAPHAVAFYLRELAADFHGWYNAERLLVEDEAQKQRARLALAVAVRQVIAQRLAASSASPRRRHVK